MSANKLKRFGMELGFVELALSVSNGLSDQLFEEALKLRSKGYPAVLDGGVTKADDGSMTTPSRFTFFAGAPRLRRLHASPSIVAAVQEATGAAVTPFHCGYNYYDKGNFLGLHRDKQRASITVTFGITANLGSMGLAPALVPKSNDDLIDLIESDGLFPVGHVNMPVEPMRFRAFAGHLTPHWRDPFEGSSGILGSMSYRLVG